MVQNFRVPKTCELYCLELTIIKEQRPKSMQIISNGKGKLLAT